MAPTFRIEGTTIEIPKLKICRITFFKFSSRKFANFRSGQVGTSSYEYRKMLHTSSVYLRIEGAVLI